jgi:hypothetical protein
MQQWVGKTHLRPRQLQGYIRQLELETDDEGAVFANAIRAEYQF